MLIYELYEPIMQNSLILLHKFSCKILSPYCQPYVLRPNWANDQGNTHGTGPVSVDITQGISSPIPLHYLCPAGITIIA